MAAPDIVRVAAKVKAFREDHAVTEVALLTDFAEDEVGGVARVVGHCRAVLVESGVLLAEAFGTRALRAPKPGAQGHQDTRDPDRAMTQAVGRCLGLLGYADAESLEGDTDEPDTSGVAQAVERPATAQPPAPAGAAPPVSVPAAVPPEQLVAEIRGQLDRMGSPADLDWASRVFGHYQVQEWSAIPAADLATVAARAKARADEVIAHAVREAVPA